MIAPSRQEQMDVEAILASDTDLSSIHVASIFRGVTESEVDAMLAGSIVKAGKVAGLIILVMQPQEKPEAKGMSIVADSREHTVRIIEQVKVNRKPGWESDDAKLAAGMTADEAKDFVKAILHGQWLGAAKLMHSGSEEYGDTKGGYGWDVKFTLQTSLKQSRGADPIMKLEAGTLATPGGEQTGFYVTLTGGGHPGEVIRSTTDGTAPVPDGATSSVYAEPFFVLPGTLVRAASTATGRKLSGITQKVAA